MTSDFGKEHFLDLFDTLVAVHFAQFMLLFIIVEYLGDFISETGQAPSHRFPFIISTLIEPTAIQIASPGAARWSECQMINMLIRLAEQSASKPTQDLFARHL